MFHTIAAMTPKVQVLIPPPVEPGEAPINIKNTRTKRDGTVRLAMGRVLNPAVLAVTD